MGIDYQTNWIYNDKTFEIYWTGWFLNGAILIATKKSFWTTSGIKTNWSAIRKSKVCQ